MARPQKIRLGDMLIQQGLITPEQLEHALKQQKETGHKLGRILVDNSFVTERKIAEGLAHQLNLLFVDLNQLSLNPSIIQKLPETLARRFRAVVIADNGDHYQIGMVDPTDIFAYDEINRLLQRDIELAVVQETALLSAIDRTYRRTGEISSLAQELGDHLSDTALDFVSFGVNTNIEEAPVVKLLQTIFDDAVGVKASDIHIEPQEHKLIIRFRIDGVLHLQTKVDLKIAAALVLRLKLMSGLDISEKRHPQDGRFAVKVMQLPVDVRISTMPTQYGESVVMRLLIQNSSGFSLEKLGMPSEMLERFRKLIHKPSGMVLVTGPTGSGKTTTLYAALNELNVPAHKIITIEDPVEYRLAGINQVQVNEKIDLDFAKVLRASLRQDPDILLVGEMRDEETVQIGLRAAMTGHLVLSTLHTNDAMTAPIRLIDMGAPRFMVAMSIAGVLAQRLLRLVCQNCTEAHTPTVNEISWLKMTLGASYATQSFVHGRGCPHCNGTGYVGRIGIYELMEMSHDLVDATSHQDTQQLIQLARKKMAGHTLHCQALKLALSKRTTLAEAMRISYQPDD